MSDLIPRARAAASAATVLGLLAAATMARAVAAPREAITPAQTCTSLRHLVIPDSNMTITRANAVAATPPQTAPRNSRTPKIRVSIPAHCRVQGVIDAHSGPSGKRYGLTFSLALPDTWNGRFLYQGGGGLNGTLRPPLGGQAAGDRPALARNFAVVSTDGGHRGAVFDDSFLVDQQAALDFAFNAVPTVAVAAKRVIAAYYGRPPARSYFDGCSTGGREGMEAFERYPSLFDGVLAGSPAMRTGYSNIALKWAAVAFNGIARRNPATGQPIAGSAFTHADRRLIVHAVLNACDALDGLKDGMIFNVEACHFDPAVLLCKGAKTSKCLTRMQVKALKKAFAGPVRANGQRIYPPFPYDTGIGASASIMFPPGLLFDSTGGPMGRGHLPTSINLASEVAKAHSNALQQLTDTNRWTNLSTFSAHGGKLILYHGMSDPWFSAYDTLDYYKRVVQGNGGLPKVRTFARLYLVPGMGHCAGGPATLDRFDFLTALVQWVEQDKAPQSVVATGHDFPGRSRPLCAWPQHAQYKGHGDPNDASSFECRR